MSRTFPIYQLSVTAQGQFVHKNRCDIQPLQGSHYILVVKFKYFSRTLKLHFQGPIFDEVYSMDHITLITVTVLVDMT